MKFTENTTVSMGLVIVLCGVVFSVSTLFSRTEAHSSQLNKQDVQNALIIQHLSTIDQRLAIIETVMGVENKLKRGEINGTR